MAGGIGDAVYLEDLNDVIKWRSRIPVVLDNGVVLPLPLLPPEPDWVEAERSQDGGWDSFRAFLAQRLG